MSQKIVDPKSYCSRPRRNVKQLERRQRLTVSHDTVNSKPYSASTNDPPADEDLQIF